LFWYHVIGSGFLEFRHGIVAELTDRRIDHHLPVTAKTVALVAMVVELHVQSM
jgi:hypothetical protein